MDKENVVAVLSSYLDFKDIDSDSENLVAFCPWHVGTKPKLYVYVGTNKPNRPVGCAFCHVCGEGWGLTGLLKKLGASRKSIDIAKQIFDEFAPARKKKKVYAHVALPEAVLGAFDFAPRDLIDAGFQKETLKSFDIGFDRKRDRITFPFRDHHGNLIGFSGRTVVGDYPRYKIYTEELSSLVHNYKFEKGGVLWGLDKFYLTAMTVGIHSPVVICEGFKAAMWVAQCGFKNVVALIGDHCGEGQAKLLYRITNEVVLFLDNDEPGLRATDRVCTFLGQSIDVRIADYPSGSLGKAPDDLSKAELTAAVTISLDLKNWRIKYGRQNGLRFIPRSKSV